MERPDNDLIDENVERDAALKQRVLERARGLFFQFGFKRVTMEELSKALGVSKKTLYQFTRGKDSLIESIVAEMVEKTAADVLALFDERLDLAQMTSRVAQVLSLRLPLVSPAMILDLERHWPHLWEKVNEQRLKIIERYEGVIEWSREKGLVRPEVHPKVLMRMLQVIVTQVMRPATYLELEVTPQEVMRTVMTVLLYGALTDEAREGQKEKKG